MDGAAATADGSGGAVYVLRALEAALVMFGGHMVVVEEVTRMDGDREKIRVEGGKMKKLATILRNKLDLRTCTPCLRV
jgi:hypothetical protein